MPRANTRLTEALKSIIRITQEVDEQTNPNLLASMVATKALDTLDEHNADTNTVAAVMGWGSVSTGIAMTSMDDGTKLPSLLFIQLPEAREIDADCSDIDPVGSQPDPDRVLADIVFRNPEAVTRIIGQLIELLGEKFDRKFSLVEAGDMDAYVSAAMAGTIHPFVSYEDKHPDVGQWIVVIDKGGWPFVGQFNLDTGLDDYRCLHRLTGRYTYGWKWWAPISDFPGPMGTAKGSHP